LASTRCRWLWPLGQAALIFFLSSRPGSAYPDIDVPGLDKVVHFCLYGPLGAGLYRWLDRPLLAWGLTVAWGVSDEAHQAFVPQRTPSAADVAADAIGGAAGILLWRWRRRLQVADRAH
jgi:VanZ family protein